MKLNEVVAFALQIASALLAAGLGIASTFFDLKDAHGQITRHGRWIISGIAVSTLLSIYLLVQNNLDQAEKDRTITKNSLTTIRRADRILAQLHRSMDQLKSADVTVTAAINGTSKSEVYQYEEGLFGNLPGVMWDFKTLTPQAFQSIYKGLSAYRKEGKVVVEIYPGSEYYPSKAQYPGLLKSLQSYRLLAIMKPALKVEDCFVFDISPLEKGFYFVNTDLQMSFKPLNPAGATLILTEGDNRLYALFKFKKLKRDDWGESGLVVSMDDLNDSEMYMHLFLDSKEISFRPYYFTLDFGGRAIEGNQNFKTLNHRGETLINAHLTQTQD